MAELHLFPLVVVLNSSPDDLALTFQDVQLVSRQRCSSGVQETVVECYLTHVAIFGYPLKIQLLTEWNYYCWFRHLRFLLLITSTDGQTFPQLDPFCKRQPEKMVVSPEYTERIMACYGEDGKGVRYLDLLPLYIPLNRSSREYVSSGIPRKVAFQEILRFLGNAGIQVREFIGSTGEGWGAGDRTGQ